MKLTIGVGAYRQTGIEETVEYIQFAEKLGIHSVWSAEAWGQDAVTSLAFLAATTFRVDRSVYELRKAIHRVWKASWGRLP